LFEDVSGSPCPSTTERDRGDDEGHRLGEHQSTDQHGAPVRQRRLASPDLKVLTDREREIMVLVAAGRSNDEIAGELFISPATAKTHVSRAMSKLGARDRAQLVVLAYESGLVLPRVRST
jgi:DNA-binding NarL/FixJ family response regulator